MDVGLHHDRIQSLVDPAAWLEDDREERAFAQLGDAQLDVASLGGQRPRTAAVAFADAVLGAFVGSGADPFGCFDLDQLLQCNTHGFADQIDAVTRAERVEELGKGRLWQGHRWTSFFGECLAVHTEDPADGRLRPHASPLALKPHHSQGLLRGVRFRNSAEGTDESGSDLRVQARAAPSRPASCRTFARLGRTSRLAS